MKRIAAVGQRDRGPGLFGNADGRLDGAVAAADDENVLPLVLGRICEPVDDLGELSTPHTSRRDPPAFRAADHEPEPGQTLTNCGEQRRQSEPIALGDQDEHGQRIIVECLCHGRYLGYGRSDPG